MYVNINNMYMYTVQVYKHDIDTIHHTCRNKSQRQNIGEDCVCTQTWVLIVLFLGVPTRKVSFQESYVVVSSKSLHCTYTLYCICTQIHNDLVTWSLPTLQTFKDGPIGPIFPTLGHHGWPLPVSKITAKRCGGVPTCDTAKRINSGLNASRFQFHIIPQ